MAKAKFRMVHTTFWNDPYVSEELTAEDKYFFLYLLTNEHTTQVGIYGITKKQMAFELGYSIESVNALMHRFLNHHKLVKYNTVTRELAVKNWGRYNLNKGGKPVIDCVMSELKQVKDISLIKYVSEKIESPVIKGIYDTYHESLTIRGQKEQEQEEEQEEQQEQQEQSVVGKSVNQFGQLAQFYEQNIGALYPVIGETLGYILDEYKDADLILEALKGAVTNQARNKMKYAEGTLKNWKDELITSYEQLKAKEARANGAAKQPNATNPSRTTTEIEMLERANNYKPDLSKYAT